MAAKGIQMLDIKNADCALLMNYAVDTSLLEFVAVGVWTNAMRGYECITHRNLNHGRSHHLLVQVALHLHQHQASRGLLARHVGPLRL